MVLQDRTGIGRGQRAWALLVAVTLASTSALFVVGPSGEAGAAPPPPPNPSDQQISASQSQVSASATEVGRLSGVVSSTQAKIQQLQDAMELKAELAMKAMVDLATAKANAKQAEQDAKDARAAVGVAADKITTAQDQAAAFAAASFRQGSMMGSSLTALLDADSIDQFLISREMIDQVSANQASVLDTLASTQATKANLDSKARAALAAASAAEKDAQQAQADADKAQKDAEQSFADGQSQLASLTSQLEQQQSQYQSALNQVAELKGQRAQYQAWLKAKQEEDQRIAAQAAVQQQQAQELMREKQLADQLAAQDASNRAVAVANEKKYQQQLAQARAAQEAARKKLQQQGADPGPDIPVSNMSRGQIVVQAALAYLGTPYAWGGGTAKGPSRGIRDGGIADYYGDYNKIGFDCSGLALYAWAQAGVYLPHYSGYQFNYGQKVAPANLQPGDLVFFAYNTSNPATIHHVAIYMGNNKIIQAPQSGDVVKISPMYWNGFIGATRPGS